MQSLPPVLRFKPVELSTQQLALANEQLTSLAVLSRCANTWSCVRASVCRALVLICSNHNA